MRFVLIILLIYFREAISQATTCDDEKSKLAAISFAAVTQLAAITKRFCNNTLTTTNLKGEKGEPGANCDVINKIETLDRENKMLSQQVSTLTETVDHLTKKFNETR